MELAGYGRRYGFDENALRQRMIDFWFRNPTGTSRSRVA